jgi:hypothetical protein
MDEIIKLLPFFKEYNISHIKIPYRNYVQIMGKIFRKSTDMYRDLVILGRSRIKSEIDSDNRFYFVYCDGTSIEFKKLKELDIYASRFNKLQVLV